MNSHKFLLDTNILSDLVRNPQGTIAQRIIREGESSICTSIIVASELRFGAEKKLQQTGSKRLLNQLSFILSAMDILPFEEHADSHYAKIRFFLENQGIPIGPNDLLIASHARAEDLIMVTANFSEFSRVPDLIVENWLQNEK